MLGLQPRHPTSGLDSPGAVTKTCPLTARAVRTDVSLLKGEDMRHEQTLILGLAMSSILVAQQAGPPSNQRGGSAPVAVAGKLAAAQDFTSGSWTDDSGNCHTVTSSLSPDASGWDNATQHAAVLEGMLMIYSPVVTGCGGQAPPGVLPYGYQDVLARSHQATSGAVLAALQEHASFAMPAGGQVELATGAVGPSNEPLATITTRWTDEIGLQHEVATRQKWAEPLEAFIGRHASAVNAMAAAFPPAQPQPSN